MSNKKILSAIPFILFLLLGIFIFPSVSNAATTTDDHAPPRIISGQPKGILAAGTVQTTVSVETDELANCRYSNDRQVLYDSMSSDFINTNFTAIGTFFHSVLVTGLSSDATYNYYVKCSDARGNANPDDFLISFSTPPDVTPPVISNGQPSGSLAVGTTQANLSLVTNEPATCRYSTTSVVYGLMPSTFSITGGISHSVLITGLSGDNPYTYYVRCSDNSGNVNTDDFTISFSIAPSPTLFVTLTASASSGPAPLNGVDLTADVSGTAAGTINYTFYCDRSDSGTNIASGYDVQYNSIVAVSKEADDACNYLSSGTYHPKVIAERESKIAEARAEIIVTAETPEATTKTTLEGIQARVMEIQQKIIETIKNFIQLVQASLLSAFGFIFQVK
ncbi:MAG: hypothetical protein HYW70_03545 [Candidatus Nealsonbacteria bacterium]|nr:hypothetical protein [Candidatus Nealsonbacteria bacterium]